MRNICFYRLSIGGEMLLPRVVRRFFLFLPVVFLHYLLPAACFCWVMNVYLYCSLFVIVWETGIAL